MATSVRSAVTVDDDPASDAATEVSPVTLP